MGFDVTGLLDLWAHPLPDPQEARTAFSRWYADPVTINRTPVALADLAQRASGLQGAFETISREVDCLLEADDRVVVSFRMGGRQVGPLPTSAGVLAPTQEWVTLRVIDILTVRDGLITDITMVADELGGLAAVGAVTLS